MKRCPQCEFTFEDREQVCDFDGTELIAVPEPPLPKIKLPSAAGWAPIQRLMKSPMGLGVLVIGGLILSALAIGYYDSANQEQIAAPNLASSQPRPGQPEAQTSPKRISTQRKLAANKRDAMPSSILKSPTEPRRSTAMQRSHVAKSATATTTQHLAAHRKSPGIRKVQSAHLSVQASNQKRSTGRSSSIPRHTESAKLPNTTSASVHRHVSANTDRKDSKFIAILKKTGSILSKPFRF